MCEELKKSMLGLQSSAQEIKMRTSGRGTDDRTDIRGDANTPRPLFVGRGIKSLWWQKVAGQKNVFAVKFAGAVAGSMSNTDNAIHPQLAGSHRGSNHAVAAIC